MSSRHKRPPKRANKRPGCSIGHLRNISFLKFFWSKIKGFPDCLYIYYWESIIHSFSNSNLIFTNLSEELTTAVFMREKNLRKNYFWL